MTGALTHCARRPARRRRPGAIGGLSGSDGSRRPGANSRSGRPQARDRRERGVALVIVMTVIAILTIYLSEMIQNNATAFHVAVSQRDKVKAEYIAKSGLNLTRLLIANEQEIRKVVEPIYKMVIKRSPPQLNVWDFADQILAPFISQKMAQELGTGLDFSQMEGVKETDAEIEIIGVPENAKINLSKGLFNREARGSLSLANQLFTLMGGGQQQSPYDSMFEREDPDGNYTTRLDIISDIIDWWDHDQVRTIYDPGTPAVTDSGSEDDIYSRFKDPYVAKNAHFDSLEELRLVRGVSDDFWANFVEPDPTDPRTRKVTIYGSGRVNANGSPPQVLLARICGYTPQQPLCNDPVQQLAFIQLFQLAQGMMPIALFSRPSDLIDFVTGQGDLYGMVAGLAGDSPLMAWTPLQLDANLRREIEGLFITEAAIFTIQSTARVGRSEVRLSAVVNFHGKWTPPPPNPGQMPKLGIFHHYRVD